MSVIDLLLLLAPIAIAPMALRLVELDVPLARSLANLTLRCQPVGALLVVIALFLRPGLFSSLLAAAWLLACVPAGLAAVVEVLRGERRAAPAVGAAACGYLVVGALWLVVSRAGLRPLGFPTVIVELTAVHFHYTGLAALTLAQQVILTTPSGGARHPLAAIAGLGLAVGSPVTAAGFTLISPALQLVGVVMIAVSVMVLAVITLGLPGLSEAPAGGRWLLRISALSVFLPMPLAIDYTLAKLVRVPALGIPEMALVHGLVNALLLCGCGLGGWLIVRRSRRMSWRG